MKRPRHHKRRPKFLSPEPIGDLAELPDLLADLPEEIRSELPNELPTAASEWRVTRKRGEDE
jgi:hypothetical protein